MSFDRDARSDRVVAEDDLCPRSGRQRDERAEHGRLVECHGRWADLGDRRNQLRVRRGGVVGVADSGQHFRCDDDVVDV